MKYYSQYGQDLIIENYFKDLKAGLFISVGELDGTTYSNVRHMYELGWSGICIEPVKKSFNKLNNLYKNTSVVCLNIACSDYNGEADINVGTDVEEVSTFHQDEMGRWPDIKFTKQHVTVRTLDKILDRFDIGAFDLLSIDTEGEDLKVLQGLDMEKHTPKLVVVEFGVAERSITRHMQENKYRLISRNEVDLFFERMP